MPGKSPQERGAVAWKKCEDDPTWDPAVDRCIQRALQTEHVSEARATGPLVSSS